MPSSQSVCESQLTRSPALATVTVLRPVAHASPPAQWHGYRGLVTLSSPALESGPQLASPVVSTQWLADHLGSDRLIVLDATVVQIQRPDGGYHWLSGFDQYLVNGHVPGALFAELLDSFSDPAGLHGFAKPSARQFEAAAAALGVNNETTVVVYDTSVGQWAARIWWLFRAFGYDNVAVLDGGLTKWIVEERPTERGWIAPLETATFTASPRPELWADTSRVRSIVTGETDAALVCGLPAREFTGETGQRPRRGHIPGSFSAPAGRLVDRETNALLPAHELRATFANALASSEHIIAYCAGGIAAAADALALAVIGHTNVAVYDGSLNEWAADPALPLVTLVDLSEEDNSPGGA